MVKHNNAIHNQHFRKDWARRVKTWFAQPIQKKLRREKRKVKAAQNAPRPASGALRPLVHCQTQRYNTKVRLGRGFTLEELKAAGISSKFAQTVGIAVDHRRVNKCEESLKVNADRLKAYRERLIIFPRRQGKFKKGDSSAAEIAEAVQQTNVDIASLPSKSTSVEYADVTDEMKAAKGYSALRQARTEARLKGLREKMAREKEEADK
mmetsp:Transcript_118606/g.335505  ORF Transcript_118606/g.335505 Transcript_118606/m.335505 type:complete len:208 (-) Transcript_118606:52-675(-)|eukprot:CAMPEP_0117529676 /NCGR_PEP_ID=MMETSP0784-20121206/37954_1 /TAXON_ID=39447 /ORGANISM="" /LENGTH=207 /DNA_ID=CAMNT_0005326003 /DNA_START=37 /DNA_END=660 /DNA_ORIENTATION=+